MNWTKIKNNILFLTLFFVLTSIAFLVFFNSEVLANMANVNICVEGASYPSDGVFEFQDLRGEKRYIEIGRQELEGGSIADHPNDNCSIFYSWQEIGPAGRQTLFSSWLSVPGIGRRRRSSRNEFSGWGCQEQPMSFSVKTTTHICTHATLANFPNDGPPFNLSVQCSPINNTPNIEVSLPDNCVNSGQFQIQASDQDGPEEIKTIKLKINSEIFIVSVNGYEAVLQNSVSGNLEAVIRRGSCGFNACRSGNTVLVNLEVENLDTFCSQIQINGWVEDIVGDNSGWVSQGSYLSGKEPLVDIALNEQQPFDGDRVNFVWTLENNCPGISSCSISCNSGCSNCTLNPICPVSGETVVGRGSCQFDPRAEEITFTLNVGTNGCFDPIVDQIDVGLPNPWLMTGWGDIFGRDGFSYYPHGQDSESITLWHLNYQTDIPVMFEGGAASFSTSLITKSSAQSFWPSSIIPGYPRSFNQFILDTYSDNNQEKVGIDGSYPTGYNYLLNIAESNNCGSYCEVYESLNASDAECSGDKINFVDGNLLFSQNYLSDEDEACVFVVSGNVIVEPAVSTIEAFIILDGTFDTRLESDGISDNILYVEGGIITSRTSFKRRLENNIDNPSELINYDAKYLHRIKDLLGKEYRFTIKEYRYADTTN